MSLEFRKKLFTVGVKFTAEFFTEVLRSKRRPWGFTKEKLRCMPEGSLGNCLSKFLDENGLDIIPSAERHDCFHVLCNYNTEVESEIALQYLRLGNGGKNFFTIGAVVIGTILLPEYYDYYMESFLLGKKSKCFQKLDFKDHLTTSLEALRVQHFEQIQFINPIL